ncbi:hypothetical protein Leryth_002606 [Lithospermum erythrorhizon]|nr:hypothetical protein Leryth_002606 [Lithospermum erythrorhizon]
MEKVDDDYEDGEVRELPLKSVLEDPTRGRMLSENIKEIDDGSEMGVPPDQSTIYELHDERNVHNEPTEALINENCNQHVSNYVSLPVTISEQVASVQTEAKVPENSLVNLSVEDNVPGVQENELIGHGETNLMDIILESVSVARNENNKVSNEAGKNDNGDNVVGISNSSLSKVKVTVNEHNSFKDSAFGGKGSRIITLPRASNSPSKIRSLPGRSFTAWSGRERYSHVDGGNLQFQGNREDTYADESRKFTWDRSFRTSRMDFKRDRGRDSGRFNSLQKKWDFPSKSYDVPADRRFNRTRRASAVADSGLRSNDFVVAPHFTGTSASRIGRKPLTEEFRSFRQSSSRRLSPESRDGGTIRSLPNLHRIPESGSDSPGLRHKRFLRGLPDDISDPVYTRPQASYDEIGDQFVRGNQEFCTIQRRVFPWVRSKSPRTSRAPPRSPGTWASSRRRFNDDFNNQIQHRPMYKVERMRSPDRVCYTDDLGDRRRVSPNYVARANEPRDMDFTRENGHIRPTISGRRSPSDLMFPRTTRRLNVVDSRGRTDSDEYFSRPIHSCRFHEFRGDGSNVERRKSSEQRGLFRPSRPSHGGGNENYSNNAEDGSRPLRFCSDHDTESFQRSNVRQRDVDGGTKTRPLKHRQISSTESREGSFRQAEEVWHDESFSDGSGMKKRRFGCP